MAKAKGFTRGQGEGTIYQRRDGRWHARVTVPDAAGKRHRKDYYGATRAEVAGKMAAALADLRKGIKPVSELETVGAFLVRWLESTARANVRPSTYESYERLIRLHVVPHIGAIKLARLTALDLSELYATLRAKDLSARTVQYVHAVVHRGLKQAERWDLISRNPADLLDAPRLSNRPAIRPLSAEQCAQLLWAAEDDRLHALYVLAITTGMRQAELLGVRWQDVDLTRGAVAVRQQAIRVREGGFVFSEPKTAKGKRSIALPAVSVDELRAHRIRQYEERLQLGPAWTDYDLVFPSEVGTPIERQNLMRRSFWPILDWAGLPRIRFHDLRHTAATLMLTQGVHPKVVQERLGHSTIGVTLDVYSHVLPDMQQDAAAKIDALFQTI